MADCKDLVAVIKRAAIEAVKAAGPIDITCGNVISVKPLKINIDQKKTLDEDMLVLCRNVTDYETEITITSSGEHDQYSGNGIHSHDKVKATIFNSLKVGDKVLVACFDGGQEFVVIDKVVQS